MAMLGALHGVTLGVAPAQLMALFSSTTPPSATHAHQFDRQRLRHWRPPHSKQLRTEAHFQSSDVFLRSVFGLVVCYNKLPRRIVDTKGVKIFQRELQLALQKGANTGLSGWQLLYSSVWKRLPVAKFDELFSYHIFCGQDCELQQAHVVPCRGLFILQPPEFRGHGQS